MTDKEVIKALECCIKAKTNADCEALKCPFYDNEIDICMCVNNEEVLYANALDLINRQQAEIENLKAGVNVELENYASEYDSKIKAEAIKEFWSKLKIHSRKMQSSDFSGEFWDKAILIADGDNILKEMVGE